jgi:hypothetical protein
MDKKPTYEELEKSVLKPQTLFDISNVLDTTHDFDDLHIPSL